MRHAGCLLYIANKAHDTIKLLAKKTHHKPAVLSAQATGSA